MDRITADISQLVNRCRRGEPDAFEPLVQRFQNAGYAIALGMVESGPHPGEVFSGTNRRADGPETSTAQTTDLWAAYLRAKGEGVNRLVPADLYPEIGAHFMPFPEELRHGMKNAARLSIVQDKAQALVLPRDAYRPRLQKVFRPNANDPDWVHGPVGYISLTVRVPAGRCLTVIRADQVEVREAQCSVHLLQCSTADIEDVHGNVYLVETPATQMCRIRGQVRQSFYCFGGMNWEDDALRAKRWRQYACRVEDIEGDVDLDVGRMDLELTRLNGRVQVTNRYGDTRFHARTWPAGAQCSLQSVCGSVRIFLNEELATNLALTVLTLCGSISYPAYRDKDKGEANSTQLASFSTIPPTGKTWQDALEAQLVVKTESGDVEIERMI